MNSEIDSTRFQYGAVLVVHTATQVIDDTWFAKFFYVVCNLYPLFVQGLVWELQQLCIFSWRFLNNAHCE
jgi:hypothetical protein